MSRRLMNRGSTAAASPRPPRHEPTELPPYEAPSYPLNQAARAKLDELNRTRETSVYNAQIQETLRNLGHSVYDLQLRLERQKQRLEQVQSRRQQRGGDIEAEEEKLINHVKKLEHKVEELTGLAEGMIRTAIDLRVGLEDDAAILRDIYTNAEAERRRPDESTEEPQNVQSTLNIYQEAQQDKKEAFQRLPPYERYARDNDYAAFKKLWHSAIAGDDGPPLPDANKWFDVDGTPVMRIGEDDEDEDDDLVVQRETLSLKCPLTFTEFIEPYSNRKCKHTFEKKAILEYIQSGRGRPVKCPQTGDCPAEFSKAKFNEDFFLDQVMLRRVQRAKEAEEQQNIEGSGDEDDGDESILVRGQKNVGRTKRERE